MKENYDGDLFYNNPLNTVIYIIALGSLTFIVYLLYKHFDLGARLSRIENHLELLNQTQRSFSQKRRSKNNDEEDPTVINLDSGHRTLRTDNSRYTNSSRPRILRNPNRGPFNQEDSNVTYPNPRPRILRTNYSRY